MNHADKNNENKSSHENKINTFIQKYSNKMEPIQEKLLFYIDNYENEEENFLNLTDHLSKFNIIENKAKMKSFLYILLKISDNHQRKLNFFNKIESVLSYLQIHIQKYFSNFEIFNIFKSNKRVLFYLFKKQIIVPDQNIFHVICSKKYAAKQYPQYFSIEKFKKEKKIEQDFDLERSCGENDNYICELIRKDSVEDFIANFNRNKFSLNSKIKSSIYETNDFLIDKQPTLIEYATFFGSIQIIQYMLFNKVKLTSSLWLYAIHGNNPDVIHLLEDNHITPNDSTYFECFIESIKCHHNEIANYLKDNYLYNYTNNITMFKNCIKYYNFSFFSSIKSHEIGQFIYYFCKYDHIAILKYLIKKSKYNVNSKIISNLINVKIKTNLLNIAIKKGNIEIINALIKKFNVDINSNYLKTDVKITDNHINDNHYKSILEKIEEKSPLVIAIENANVEIVELLLKQSKIDLSFGFIFKTSEYNIKENKIEEKSVQNYQESKSPLIIAIENNLSDICQLLSMHKIYEKYILSNSLYKRNPIFYNIKYLHEEKIEKDPLIIAIEIGNLNIIRSLLSDPQLITNSKYTKTIYNSKYEEFHEEADALIYAIEKNKIEIIKILLAQKNINVNVKKKIKGNGKLVVEKSALIIATEKENEKIVKLLLKKKDIDVNAKYSINSRLIAFDFVCFDYYMDKHANNEERTALYIAVDKENEKITKMLLKKKGINTNSLLHQSISFVYWGQGKKYYTNQNFSKSEFYLAVEKGNLNILKHFIKIPSIDVNSYININSNSEIYKFYKSEGVYCESYNKLEEKCEEITPIHCAVQNGSTEIVKLLLSRPEIDINKKYVCQKTQKYNTKVKSKKEIKSALHIAVANQKYEIIQLLLSKSNINVNSKYIKSSNLYNSPQIKTAILLAVENNNKDIIQLLLKQKKLKIPNELENISSIKSLLNEH